MFNFFTELKNMCCEIKNKITPYQIVTMGDYLMYIEGELKLATLCEENVVIKVKDGMVVISGKNLTIKNMTQNTMTICGKISSWEKI